MFGYLICLVTWSARKLKLVLRFTGKAPVSFVYIVYCHLTVIAAYQAEDNQSVIATQELIICLN